MHKDIISKFKIFMDAQSRPFYFYKHLVFIRLNGISMMVISLLIAFSLIIGSCNLFDGKKNNEKDAIPPYPLPAGEKLDAAEVNQLKENCTAWYDSILKNSGFNGAVLVAKKGTIVFEKYQGLAHLEGEDKINEQTSFHIASVSKTFTAMAVLKLFEEKKLSIDDEFSKYFPTFNYPGVTIRTLLSHRSGLPNYVYFIDEIGWDKNVFVKNQDVFNILVDRKNELKNITPPNRHFSYCNTNYALLALLIEKLSNSTYPQFIKKYIFDPLQMTHSFVYTQLDSSRITPSYDWRGQPIPFNQLDMVYGDKNIYSTVEDLLKWDRLLSTNLFLSTSSLKEAYTPYSNEKAGIKNYGLGWRMNIYPDGKKTIFHNGWWHGNNASFIRLIDEDATIIVLGNRYNRGIYKSKLLIKLFDKIHNPSEEDEGENPLRPVAPNK